MLLLMLHNLDFAGGGVLVVHGNIPINLEAAITVNYEATITVNSESQVTLPTS